VRTTEASPRDQSAVVALRRTSPLLSSPRWLSGNCYPAFRRVEILVGQMPRVNLPHERVFFAHSGQYRNNRHKTRSRNQKGEKRHNAHSHEREDESTEQNQFAIAAHQELRPI